LNDVERHARDDVECEPPRAEVALADALGVEVQFAVFEKTDAQVLEDLGQEEQITDGVEDDEQHDVPRDVDRLGPERPAVRHGEQVVERHSHEGVAPPEEKGRVRVDVAGWNGSFFQQGDEILLWLFVDGGHGRCDDGDAGRVLLVG
jgi:hypothetical protein